MSIRIKFETLTCETCPLNYRNKVFGEGSKQGKIIFLGEAPGREEDEQGVPFVGKSGKYLNQMLVDLGIDRYSNWVTNIICCRPPENNFNHPDTIKAREFCRSRLEEELSRLKEFGYKILVPLGLNSASFFFPAPVSMGTIRGKLVNLPSGLMMIPTYHPSFIARNMALDDRRFQNNLWKLWKNDFEQILQKISQETK